MPSLDKTPSRSGLLLAALGAIGFSGKAIIAKLCYRHGVDAVTVLMWRMLLALPLFLALAAWAGRGKPALTRRDWIDIALLGFTGYYLASALDFAGLQYVSAGLERLILYLNPTLVLLIGVLFLKQHARARQWGALALSYAGVALAFAQELHFNGPHTLRGALLVLGSAISYAVYLAHSGRVVHRIGALRLTGWATSVAALLCIVQFLVLKPGVSPGVPSAVIGLSALNATLCTFVPVIAVMLAVQRIGAPLAAQVGMVGPFSTLLLAALLLDEPFTATMLAGTVMVMGGVWAVSRPR